MTDLSLSIPAPLAIDRDGQSIDTGSATHWIIKRWAGGRPGLLKDADGEPVLLGLQASKTELRKAVGFTPGVYRLFPADDEGNKVNSLYAEIEFSPEEFGQQHSNDYAGQMVDRLFGMLEKRDESNRAVMGLLCDVLRSQGSALIDQQRSSAEMLRAANETIKVANGVDALERQLPAPQVDVESLASALAENLGNDDDDEDCEPEGKFSKFVKSPMFGMLASFVNGFAQPLLQLHQTRMKAQIEAETLKSTTTKPTEPASSAAHTSTTARTEPVETDIEPEPDIEETDTEIETEETEPEETDPEETETDELDSAGELVETEPETADQVPDATTSSTATQRIDGVTIIASWGPRAPDMESIDITLPHHRAPGRAPAPRTPQSDSASITLARSRPDKPVEQDPTVDSDQPEPRPRPEATRSRPQPAGQANATRSGPDRPGQPDPRDAPTDEPGDEPSD